MYDPVADADETERKPIAPRLERIEGARVGLFDNGKPAAEPLLDVVEERLAEAYPSVTVDRYAVDHLNRIKNEEEMAAIQAWADEKIDACIGAIGDCGSCTKFLVYGIEAVERSGTPGVGLVDDGFTLDWETNARDFGRRPRYYTLSAISEVLDRDRFREQLTVDVLDEVLEELTRPPTPDERAAEDAEAGSTGVIAGGER